MKRENLIICSRLLSRAVAFALSIAAILTFLLAASNRAVAGSATWSAFDPDFNEWSDSNNWDPATVPNGATDVATFSTSDVTDVWIPGSFDNLILSEILFDSAADNFTIARDSSGAANLQVQGAGITNNSGRTQEFYLYASSSNAATAISFINSSTAGALISFVVEGAGNAGGNGGYILFRNTSSAGSALFSLGGSYNSSGRGSHLYLYDNSTASAGRFFLGSGANGADIDFLDSSTAGSGSFTNYGGGFSGAYGGLILFQNSSTAANGTFFNKAGVSGAIAGGNMAFWDTSSAGQGNFFNEGMSAANPSQPAGGYLIFTNNATAASSVINNSGGTATGAYGGTTIFDAMATAGSATLRCNGGSGGGAGGLLLFDGDSTGGTSQVQVFGNGEIDVSGHNAPGLTIGSLEGTGNVFLGGNKLTIGSRNTSPTFSGTIQDGGIFGGTGGSLTKIGTGTFTLSGSNTYTGGTAITGGTLVAQHDGALGGGDVNLLTPGATLTLQSGATNNYIADYATVNISSSATLNLNYSGQDIVGVLIIDGVAQTPGLYGTGSTSFGSAKSKSAKKVAAPNGITGNGQVMAELPVAYSRKNQGGTNYDLYLPATGKPAIECRSGGANNIYQIVVSCLNPATFTDAQVTSGNGTVTSATGTGTTTLTINLTGVTSAQRINVTLSNFNDGLATRDLVIPMAVLVGDTTGDGQVNSADVSQTKSRSGQSINSNNFRSDVTGEGIINSSDVSLVKSRSGTALP